MDKADAMKNETVCTAVVGAGKMGRINAKVYDQLPQSELVAVVDIDAARAKLLADNYGCAAYTDCSEILGKADAVTIATPTVTHLKLAKIFIKNKIPVLIEKPLAASVREGSKIAALARKNDTDLFVIFPVYYAPDELAEDPELAAVTADGEPAKEDWVEFACPSRTYFRRRRIDEARAIAP